MSITLILVIVTGLISYQAFNDPGLKAKLLHRPVAEHRNKEYYRLLTHGFVHADLMHLGINMFVLYQFGEYVETTFVYTFGALKGRMVYLLMYLITIVAASLFTHFKHKDNTYYSALGASGATSGLLFSFVLFNPWQWFLFPPAPAIIFAVLYLFYSSWASKNSRDNIGHDAHFWGALFGVFFTIAINPRFLESFFEKLMQPSGFPF